MALVAGNNSPLSRSHFQKTVTLLDWWLIKPETNDDTKALGVGGLTSQQYQAARCFKSAPIIKIYNLFELETSDNVCVNLQGYINKDQTLENGFSPEVFNHFVIGFPHNWREFSTNCPKIEPAEKCVTRDQEEDGKGCVGEFPGKLQNCDSSVVDLEVEACSDMTFSNKTSTPLNPPSVEIPQEHIMGAGIEVLCESSEGFMDDQSLKMNPTVSNPVDSSTKSKCLENRSRRMTRSMKKMGSSENDCSLVKDTSSNLDKAAVADAGILGSSVNVVDCDMKTKSRKTILGLSGGSEKETSSFSEEAVLKTSTPLNPPSVEIPQEHIMGAGIEVLCESSEGFMDDQSLKMNPTVSNPVDSSTKSKCLENRSRRMTRSMKKMGSSENDCSLVKDTSSNLDKAAVTDAGILGSSVNVVDCDMKTKSRKAIPGLSGGCEKETASYSEEVVLKMRSKRRQTYQHVDHVIAKDINVADVSGESRIDTGTGDLEENPIKSKCSDPLSNTSAGVIDVNDNTRTDMKSCMNKKKTRTDVVQKDVSSTHGIGSKEAEANVTRSKSNTKLPVKRKLIASPKSAKFTSSGGKKDSIGYGSKERCGSAHILPLDSFSGRKSRSGRVILPPLEFWRNQMLVHDEDGQVRGVQMPK